MNYRNKRVWLINQYAATPETGMGGRSFYMARELAKLGYEVYLISGSFHHKLRNVKDYRGLIDVDDSHGFKHVRLRLLKYAGSGSKKRALNWFIFALLLRLVLPFKIKKPDTIIYSSPALVGFLGARLLARKYSVPLIFEVRDIWPLTHVEVGGYSTGHLFIRLLQWIEDKAYKLSDHVVSNLKYSVEHMIQRGMSRDKFTWIPNGFSLDEVVHPEPLSDFNSEALPEGKFVVGYAGAIGMANSLDTLVSAADILKGYPDIEFVLVGDGREKEYLKQLVKEKKLTNILFVDPIPKTQIQSMIARFDACYIGLKKDPLFKFGVSPNKLFDYLYSSKPIIYAIDSGDYRPVTAVEAGISVEPENAASIAKAVLKIRNMTLEQRQIMGSNGHKLAVENHEYGQLAKKFSLLLNN